VVHATQEEEEQAGYMLRWFTHPQTCPSGATMLIKTNKRANAKQHHHPESQSGKV